MNKFHFSTTECFDSCPYQFKLRYLGDIDTVPTDDPQSPLKLGTAIHRAMETDIETAVNEYLMCYPVIDDRHINEVIKMEYWIPKLKELLPEGIHELNFSNKVYEGTAYLLVPVGKHEQMETALCGGKVLCQYKSYDLYDFKYSNNIDHYIESRQLHVYKHYLEKIKSVYIRRMFFVFVPKVMIKQKKTESIEQFRQRLKSELKQKEIQIKEIVFDQSKVDDFHETCMEIGLTTEFQKNQSQLCKWCQYQEFCERGVDYMLLPSAERRVINKVTKRKIWIYGMPMSGKTYMADTFPSPINLNTDGNVQFVTMALLPIKDTYEGRQKIPAWQVFKNAIDELERTAEENDFKTLVADLTEDLYESCRLFMYDKLGIKLIIRLIDRNDNHLNRSQMRRQYKSVVI